MVEYEFLGGIVIIILLFLLLFWLITLLQEPSINCRKNCLKQGYDSGEFFVEGIGLSGECVCNTCCGCKNG